MIVQLKTGVRTRTTKVESDQESHRPDPYYQDVICFEQKVADKKREFATQSILKRAKKLSW